MSKQKNILAALLLCAVGVSAHAQVIGYTSNGQRVLANTSSPLPFGSGDPGLSFNDGGWSNYINLQNGPIKHTRIKHGAVYNWLGQEVVAATPINGTNLTASVDGNLNPKYLELRDVNPVIGWFTNPTLGQIWYENRANNTEVYSVRQIANPAIPAAPKFGGLVMAKVPDMPANGNVYFGEWAPRAGNPSTGSSTDLNMNSAERTVWYVGENPTGNTQNLANATYNVVGVNKHTPGQNDFYTGTVTAAFGTNNTGTMAGGISRGADTLSFDGVNINNTNGTFASGAGNSEVIQGRFFGSGAAAMAGIAERGNGVGDDVAFGGHKQ